LSADATGVIVFAHGSRVESANDSVRAVARELVCASGCERVEAAFLELGVPDMEGAADRLVAAGAERIVVIPYFLTFGLHMERDLPRLVEAVAAKHPGVRIEVTAPLDGHPALVTALADRLRG
jgi:sirohydrochlorin ferrochelatase